MRMYACIAFVLLFIGIHLWLTGSLWNGTPQRSSAWRILDTQGRTRVKIEELADGTFHLAFLDASGTKKLSIGMDALGSPHLELFDANEQLRMARTPGGTRALALSSGDGQHNTYVSSSGIWTTTADHHLLTALHVGSTHHAECTVWAKEDRGVSMYSTGNEAGIRIGHPQAQPGMPDADAGLVVRDFGQDFWLGQGLGQPDRKQKAPGLWASNMTESGPLLDMTGAQGSTPLVLQSTRTAPPPIRIGGTDDIPAILFHVAPGASPTIQAVDAALREIWAVPRK